MPYQTVIAKWVAIVFLFILFAIGCFDVWAKFRDPPGIQVSQYIRDWSGEYPLLPFACGMLAGHLFWSSH